MCASPSAKAGGIRKRLLSQIATGEGEAGEEFAVGIIIKTGALDVEEFEAGHEAREGERVDRELRDRLVGAGVRFVVENVHGAVPDLQEIYVTGDRPGLAVSRHKFDAVLCFECSDVGLGEPDRNTVGCGVSC